jgi:DNA-binding MarR family transcriptional regulator
MHISRVDGPESEAAKRSALIGRAMELDRQVDRFVRRRSTEAWMQMDLTVPQLKTLFYVSSEGGTNPSRLATALHVTRSNVTGIVDRLAEQGLLSRQGRPEDRRILLLKTTAKGERILADLEERRRGGLREILAGMSTGELESVVCGLSALARSAYESDETYQVVNGRSQGSREKHSGTSQRVVTSQEASA